MPCLLSVDLRLQLIFRVDSSILSVDVHNYYDLKAGERLQLTTLIFGSFVLSALNSSMPSLILVLAVVCMLQGEASEL